MIECNVCKILKDEYEFYIRKETGRIRKNCKRCIIEGKRKEVIIKDTKICKHCGEDKPFSEFQKAGGGNWLQPYCKPCDSERKRKWESENKSILKVKRNAYYEQTVKPKYIPHPRTPKTKEQIRERQKLYSNQPHVKIKKSLQDKKYKQKYPEKIKANREKNKEKALQHKKEWQRVMMNNLEFRIKKNLRSRIHVALKRGIKSLHTMELLGCSIDEFKNYFCALFTEEMNWEKYLNGEIVIDHIIPCVRFDLTKIEEQKKCFHYTNLQPLWKLDNLIKGTRIEYKIAV